ncbi:MAG: InlB B-repeat-containing protein [Clostridia bacterium]|nr:InlB B-repeat-containing protein [Clostridia bacterium]
MRKTKIVYLILALLVAVSAIISCGDNSGNEPPSENNKVQITFVTSTGMEIGTSVVNKGDSVRYPNPPMIPGMTFEGWDKQIFSATENTTITAIYVPFNQNDDGGKGEMVLVSFFDINGNIIFSERIMTGERLEYIPQAPQIEGKRFMGWSETPDIITEELNIYPIYEDLVSYEVSFYDYDGRWIETVTAYENKSVTPPSLERRGYDLIGWSQDLTCINSSLEVYPIYQLITQSNVLDISNKISKDGTCTLTFTIKGNVCLAGMQGDISVPNNFTIEEFTALDDGLAARQQGNKISFVFTSVSGENITSEVNLFSITLRCTDNTYFARMGVNISMAFDEDFNSVGLGGILGNEFFTGIRPKS